MTTNSYGYAIGLVFIVEAVTIQHSLEIAFSTFVYTTPEGRKGRKCDGSLWGWGRTGRFLSIF